MHLVLDVDGVVGQFPKKAALDGLPLEDRYLPDRWVDLQKDYGVMKVESRISYSSRLVDDLNDILSRGVRLTWLSRWAPNVHLDEVFGLKAHKPSTVLQAVSPDHKRGELETVVFDGRLPKKLCWIDGEVVPVVNHALKHRQLHTRLQSLPEKQRLLLSPSTFSTGLRPSEVARVERFFR